MKIVHASIETTNDELEVGKIYQYKESFPSALCSFRLDELLLEKGGEWVTLKFTILNSIDPEDVGRKTSIGFTNDGGGYFGGMFRIYDDGTYPIPKERQP